MRDAWKLWRGRPAVRGFFLAHAQGALGDAAGYVALLLLAYDRIGSAWAATALTLADFGPAMVLCPLFGALVDRRGALRCAVASDLLRAGAFAGLALVDSTAGLVAFALTAGVGSALSRPATGALIPALTTDEQLPAANALHGMVREGGQLLGPALAAGLLLVMAPEAVLGLNAATFAVSALLLARLGARIRPVSAGGTDAREAEAGGFRTVLADRRVRVLLASSGFAALTGGMLNVAELALSQHDLQAGGAGLAILLGTCGLGLCLGSGLGREGRDLLGVVLLAAGMGLAALAPALALAVPAFALIGLGNGIFYTSNRVMLQRLVRERLHGRAFGLASSIDSWAVCGAVVMGGAFVALLGARATFTFAGLGLAALALMLAASRARVLVPETA